MPNSKTELSHESLCFFGVSLVDVVMEQDYSLPLGDILNAMALKGGAWARGFAGRPAHGEASG